MTVHENIGDSKVKELYKATGGGWGGTKVDDLFKEYITKILTSQVVEKVKNDFPADWVDMMRDFEKIKRSVGLDEGRTDFCLFLLKPTVTDAYKELIGVDLVTRVKENKVPVEVKLRGKNRLQIPKTVITDMLKDVAIYIGDHVFSLLETKDMQDLKFINMVGGFSNSSVLVRQIKGVITRIPVVVPEEPELAVLKGAVMFGWKLNFISCRRSKQTYGIAILLKFDPLRDPQRLKITDDDGAEFCKNRFDQLVLINQEVESGYRVTRSYIPMSNDTLSMSITLYASKKENIRHCDELGVCKIGSLTVPMANPEGKDIDDRKVAVSVMFASTEIQVEARDIVSNKKVNAVCDFLG